MPTALEKSQGISCRLQLGWHTITAWGGFANERYQNVLRLRIPVRPLDRYMNWAVSKLPLRWQRYLAVIFPLWVLPETVILKTQKPDWDEEFENEKEWYAKLDALQGSAIPICYGEVTHGGRRALLLSDVGGVPLSDNSALKRSTDDIERAIDDAFRQFSQLGAEYNDIKLDNFHLTSNRGQDRIMILDLESVHSISNMAPEKSMVYSANALLKQWDTARAAFEAERCEDEIHEDRLQKQAARASLPVKMPSLGRPPPPLRPEDLRGRSGIGTYPSA